MSADRLLFIPRGLKHGDAMDYAEPAPANDFRRRTAHLIRIPEAAEITGLPPSLLRKSFMCEERRPKNIPNPPPHKRIGRAVYILANQLPAWVESLGRQPENFGQAEKKYKGRPTVIERIARRQQEVR
jgi:hypothetical protein